MYIRRLMFGSIIFRNLIAMVRINDEQRAQMFTLFEEGKSTRSVASGMGTNHSAVVRVRRRFANTG
jgi:hypothetical protein